MMTKNLVGWLARCPVGDNVTLAPNTMAAIEQTGRVVATLRSIGVVCKGEPAPTLGHKPIKVGMHVPPNEIWFCVGLTPKLIITYKDNGK